MFIRSSSCFKNYCCVGHLEILNLTQNWQWYVCISYLFDMKFAVTSTTHLQESWVVLKHQFPHVLLPPAPQDHLQEKQFQPFVGLKKTMHNLGEPLCLEMEAMKLNGRAHSSRSFRRISFQWHTIWAKLKKKNLILVSFASMLVLLWRVSYLEMQFLLCYFIWFSSAFAIRQCCPYGLLSEIYPWFYCL